MGSKQQGAFRGTNKMCSQCAKDCKQFSNVTVLKCNFISNRKMGGILPLAQSPTCRGKDSVKASKVAGEGVMVG